MLAENLPGNLAVWAASNEARFLHGRFIWSNWDVEEIKGGSVGKRIEEERNFLKVGVEGLAESMGSPLPPHDEVRNIITRSLQRRQAAI